MPLYDYQCNSCNHLFTEIKSIAERDKAECPLCKAEAKKLISLPAIMLDGCDPAFPGAWAKWEKNRKQKVAQQRKAQKDHGDYR